MSEEAIGVVLGVLIGLLALAGAVYGVLAAFSSGNYFWFLLVLPFIGVLTMSAVEDGGR